MTWDSDTDGGVAGSRTRVRRSSPNGAYSLGKINSDLRATILPSPLSEVRDFRRSHDNHMARLALGYDTTPRIKYELRR